MGYNPLQTFLQEAEELIADIEQSALALGSDGTPAETVNRLFRAFHTIKGSGAMCGLDAVAGFTHHVESLLDRVREGVIPASAPLADLVLKATDHIKILLTAAQGGAAVPPGSSETLVAAIAEFVDPGAPSHESGSTAPVEHVAESAGGTERTWQIRFHPSSALLANGGNPVALLLDLRRLGSCDVTAHTDEVPTLDVIQTDRCYLWWTIELRAACDENAIHDVFIFVEDDSRLEIHEVECAAANERSAAASMDGPSAGDSRRSEAPGASGTPHTKTLTREATVRVPAERLDRLVNLVGEFVMNQSRVARVAAHRVHRRRWPTRCRNWSAWSPS